MLTNVAENNFLTYERYKMFLENTVNQQEQFGVFDRADRIDPIKTKNKGRSSQFGLDASDLTDDYLVNDL